MRSAGGTPGRMSAERLLRDDAAAQTRASRRARSSTVSRTERAEWVMSASYGAVAGRPSGRAPHRVAAFPQSAVGVLAQSPGRSTDEARSRHVKTAHRARRPDLDRRWAGPPAGRVRTIRRPPSSSRENRTHRVVSHDAAKDRSADPPPMLARAWRWFFGPLRFDAQVCPACWRHHVTAVRWQLAARDRLLVSLRCGSCGHRDQRVLTRDQARWLERRLMASWADAFIAALHQDLIGAGDFERSAST